MPRYVLLYISAGDGQEGDEAHDESGQHQCDPATPPAQAAHVDGLAQKVGKGSTQRAGYDVGNQKAKMAFQWKRQKPTAGMAIRPANSTIE